MDLECHKNVLKKLIKCDPKLYEALREECFQCIHLLKLGVSYASIRPGHWDYTVIQANCNRTPFTFIIHQMCKINSVATLIMVNVSSGLSPWWVLFLSTLQAIIHLFLTLGQWDGYYLSPGLWKWELKQSEVNWLVQVLMAKTGGFSADRRVRSLLEFPSSAAPQGRNLLGWIAYMLQDRV